MIRITLWGMLMVISLGLNAQVVTVFGNAKSYSGDTLSIYTFDNYITKNKKSIAKSLVDNQGNFKFKINIEKTCETFIDLDVFEGILFIEPSKNYNVILPIKTKKDDEDKVNPYFKQIQFYVKQIPPQADTLNYAIAKFEKAYNTQLIDILQKIQYKRIFNLKEKIKLINDSSVNYNNKYFQQYKKYKLAALENYLPGRNTNKLLKKHFFNKPVLYNNSAYNETLNTFAKNYVISLKTDSGSSFINSSVNWIKLNQSLSKQQGLKKTELREYILLNNLYILFYKQKKLQSTILKAFSSCKVETEIIEHKKIAQSIENSIGKMIIGTKLPIFNLKDKDGRKISLKNFNGKFVYLNFCNPKSYSCQKDLEVLKILHIKNIDKLEIVTIWQDSSIQNMKKSITENNYNWTIIYASPDVIKDYKVVSFPTYYLINPDGKLVQNPAPEPSGDFEPAYFHFYKTWNREQLRKNKSNNSLIPN